MHPSSWLVLAGITAALHIGKLPAALPTLETALNINLVEAGFLLSLTQLAGVFLGLAIGLTADRFGLRKNILIGLGLLLAASFIGGWASSALLLMLTRAVEGLGFLLTVLPVPGLLRRLVPAQKLNRMLAIWSCYMGLGVALAMLLGPSVIGWLGWQGWWWALTAFTLIVILGVLAKVPADQQANTANPALPSGWVRIKQTLSLPGPWLIGICFGLYAGQWLSIVGFLPSIYSQVGFAAGQIGLLTALVALVNVLGNLLSGLLMHRGFAPQKLLMAGFVSVGVFSFLTFHYLNTNNPWLGYFSVLLFSALGGLIPSSLFALAVKLAPNEHTISTTVGFMQQWSSFGQLILPPSIALFATLFGGWHFTGWFTASASLTGFALAWLLIILAAKFKPAC